MIAGHIQNRSVPEDRRGPSNASFAQVYVTGKDDNISVSLRQLDRGKLQMQVTQDVYAHT
jgi:hypothetical protein